jgi:hypothetical protein
MSLSFLRLLYFRIISDFLHVFLKKRLNIRVIDHSLKIATIRVYGKPEMTDIPKQIDYWIRSAEQDFEVGKYLVGAGKTRHGLFFIHLALEKILKGCFCKSQNKTPPKIHNL